MCCVGNDRQRCADEGCKADERVGRRSEGLQKPCQVIVEKRVVDLGSKSGRCGRASQHQWRLPTTDRCGRADCSKLSLILGFPYFGAVGRNASPVAERRGVSGQSRFCTSDTKTLELISGPNPLLPEVCSSTVLYFAPSPALDAHAIMPYQLGSWQAGSAGVNASVPVSCSMLRIGRQIMEQQTLKYAVYIQHAICTLWLSGCTASVAVQTRNPNSPEPLGAPDPCRLPSSPAGSRRRAFADSAKTHIPRGVAWHAMAAMQPWKASMFLRVCVSSLLPSRRRQYSGLFCHTRPYGLALGLAAAYCGLGLVRDAQSKCP